MQGFIRTPNLYNASVVFGWFTVKPWLTILGLVILIVQTGRVGFSISIVGVWLGIVIGI